MAFRQKILDFVLKAVYWHFQYMTARPGPFYKGSQHPPAVQHTTQRAGYPRDGYTGSLCTLLAKQRLQDASIRLHRSLGKFRFLNRSGEETATFQAPPITIAGSYQACGYCASLIVRFTHCQGPACSPWAKTKVASPL